MEQINIKDIFYKNQAQAKENILKPVSINWNQHSNGIVNIMKDLIGKELILTEETKVILSLLLSYFTGSEQFVEKYKAIYKQEGSLSKGIWLFGSVGSGKTVIMKTMQSYCTQIIKVNGFHFKNEIDIVSDVQTSGNDGLEFYTYNYGSPNTLCIDDFGSNNERVKYFGNDISVLTNIMTIRYNIFVNNRKLTHVSTNKSPADLMDYDVRILDRFCEMFNIIELTGESNRK